jgi:hypothetical protein
MRSGSLAIIVLTLGIASIPGVATAQGTALGYVFTGPSWESEDGRQAWALGGGGEMLTGWKGTTIGLEAAHLWFPAVESDGFLRRPVSANVVAVDVSRHFRQSSRPGRWQPFLSGGVFLAASGDAADGGFTIGGGVDRWFTRRVGLRIDARDQFLTNGYSFVGVRAGIVFR